jgi:hypothetical protein
MYPNSYMRKFKPKQKKNITGIFETNIENVLKLKGITKFNMIMVISYFHLNSYNYNSIKDLIHYIWILKLNDLILCSRFVTKKLKIQWNCESKFFI